MKKFIKGNISTSFIKEEFPIGFSGNELDSRSSTVLIATAIFIFFKNFTRNAKITGKLHNRQKQISDRWIVLIDDKSYLVDILESSDDKYLLLCDKQEITVRSSWNNGDKLFMGTVNNQIVGVKIKENNLTGCYLLQHSGSDAYVNVCSPKIAELSKFMPKIEKNPKPAELNSPITGKIVRFKVSEGDEIKAGQELVIIEAMKMENIIRTDYDVKIGAIKFKEGETVGIGQLIMNFNS